MAQSEGLTFSHLPCGETKGHANGGVLHRTAELVLAAAQLQLVFAPLGDVVHRANHFDRPARMLIGKDLRPLMHIAHFAVRAQHPVFDGIDSTFINGAGNRPHNGVMFLRRDTAEK